jgi:hypothetical protein
MYKYFQQNVSENQYHYIIIIYHTPPLVHLLSNPQPSNHDPPIQPEEHYQG